MQKQTELTKVIQANSTSKAAFKVLSQRLRFGKHTDLGKLKREIKESSGNLNQTEFLSLFKKLEKLGYGAIVIGRGGRSTRFAWNYNLGKVLQASGVSFVEAQKPVVEADPTPDLPPTLNPLLRPSNELIGVIQKMDSTQLVTFKIPKERIDIFMSLLETLGKVEK